MDSQFKIILSVFLVLVVILVFTVYFQFFINRNYLVHAEVSCDPTTEVCYVYKCDSEIEECTGIPEEDILYYKKIERNAHRLPLCDPNEDICDVTACESGEIGCTIMICNSANAEEECSNPEDFQMVVEELDAQETIETGIDLEVIPVGEGISETVLEQ